MFYHGYLRSTNACLTLWLLNPYSNVIPSPVRHPHSEHRLIILLVDAEHVLDCWRRGIREERHQQRYIVYPLDMVSYSRDPVRETGLRNRRRTYRVQNNGHEGSALKIRSSLRVCIAERLQVDHAYLHIPVRVIACHAMRVRLRGVLQRSQRNRAIPVRLDAHTFGKCLTHATRDKHHKRGFQKPLERLLPGHQRRAASLGCGKQELGGRETRIHTAHVTTVV